MNETADLKAASSSVAPSKAIAGIGRVLLWHGGALWIGHDAGSTQTHAHHAIQITLALSGSVKFRAPAGRWWDYAAAMVLPHQPHQFDGDGQSVAQIFVEPETVRGRALLARFASQRSDGKTVIRLADELVMDAVESLRRAYVRKATDEALAGMTQDAVSRLCGEEPSLSVDARITRAIEWMRARLKGPVSLAEAARVAHLSPSRFRHLFVSQTGISFRAYLLWARVGSAVGAAMSGMSWTEAAQAWGFADSAHLTRTCRRMFGIAPSMLVRASTAAG